MITEVRVDLGRFKEATPGITALIETVAKFARENFHSPDPDDFIFRIPQSYPTELNRTAMNSLVTIRPFSHDLEILRVDSFGVVSDKERMGYENVLKASEWIKAAGKASECIHVETAVYGVWLGFSLPIFCATVSRHWNLTLTQTANTRFVQASMTLGEAAKMVMKTMTSVYGTPLSLPAYFVVVRHEFDLIKETSACHILVYEVTPEKLRIALGLEPVEAVSAEAKETGALDTK